MKYSRIFFFFRDCVVQVKAGKNRVLLTVSGVFLASVLYLVSSIFINTYISSLYAEAKTFSQDAVLLTGALNDEIVNDIKINFYDYYISEFLAPISSYCYQYTWNDMGLAVIPMIIGTNSGLFSGSVYSTLAEAGVYNSNIVDGRSITSDDIANKKRVVVISELAEDIFFGGESAVGSVIELSLTGEASDKEAFIVIGVYKNSYDEEKNLEQVNSAKLKGQKNVNLLINCYIPETVYDDYKQTAIGSTQCVVVTTGTYIDVKTMISERYSSIENLEIYYYEQKVSNVDEINEDLLYVAHVIMIIMMLIAGLNLFNSMMFAIKERVSEIGIRKAIGADNCDIWNQFVFEGFIISIFGAAVAIVFITIIVTIVQIYLDRYSAFNLELVLDLKMIIEMFCYIIVMGLLASVIPAIVASKTNIIDAIRFD